MALKTVAPAIAAILLLTGCTSSSQAEIVISAEDVVATRIESDEQPRFSRVIALANGSAEIIDSLGLREILIGRDVASTEPRLESIPIVASGHQISAEKIIALKPDLVLIDETTGPAQALERVKSAGIRIEKIAEIWRVEEITSKIDSIAQLLGLETSGDRLSDLVDNSLEDVANKALNTTRIAFLYLRGGNAIYLVGGKGSGADSVIEAVGAIDVGAAEGLKSFTPLSAESLIGLKPDVLLVMTKGLESVGGVSGLIELPGVAQTPAGQGGRVIAVDDSLLLSFGARTPSLLNELSNSLAEVMR